MQTARYKLHAVFVAYIHTLYIKLIFHEYVQNMYISIPAIQHFICIIHAIATLVRFSYAAGGSARYIVSGSKFSNGRVDNEIIVKRYACEYI